MKSKICKSCEEEFDPRCSTQVYCTDECRVKGIRYQPVEKICAREECSKAFSVPRTHQAKIYCSRSCSAIINNSKSPKRQRSAVSHGSCTRPSCSNQLKQGASKYCSTKCQMAEKSDAKLRHWLETGEGTAASHLTHYMRGYLFKEQEGRCSICSMPNVWQGLELRFILDHIDGNSQNNHRDNLRLVCPNCDSQLPTYKAKNKGNGRHFRRERYAAGQSY